MKNGSKQREMTRGYARKLELDDAKRKLEEAQKDATAAQIAFRFASDMAVAAQRELAVAREEIEALRAELDEKSRRIDEMLTSANDPEDVDFLSQYLAPPDPGEEEGEKEL